MMDWDKQIEAYFGSWTWRHLVVGALVFLAVLAGVETYVRVASPFRLAAPVNADGKNSLLRWRYRGISDGFVDVYTSTKQDPFTAAWIAGSDVIVRPAPKGCRLTANWPRYFLTSVLAKQIVKIGQQPIRVDGYFQNSLGIGDIRRAAHYIISTAKKPDVIIFSLNPVVVFNDYVLFGKHSRQRAQGLFIKGAGSFDITHMLPILRPSELVLEAVGQLLSEAVRQRGYVPKIDKLASTARFPFVPVEPDESEESDSKDSFPKNPVMERLKHIGLSEDQKKFEILFSGELGRNGVAGQYLRETLTDLGKSGIPVVLYIPPVSTELDSNPAIMARMHAIESRIGEIVNEVNAPNILADLGFWREVGGPITFRDNIHITCGPSIVDRVAGLVSRATGYSIEMLPHDKVYAAAKEASE